MLKLIALVSCVVTGLSAWGSNRDVNLDAHLGEYLFSTKSSEGSEVVNRPGAAIAKDTLRITSLGRDFDRFVFAPVQERMDMPLLTIYRDTRTGELFSFFWDASTLTTEEKFNDPNFTLLNKNSWVPISRKNNELHWVFYERDPGSRIEVSVVFREDSVSIVEKEPASWGGTLVKRSSFKRTARPAQ